MMTRTRPQSRSPEHVSEERYRDGPTGTASSAIVPPVSPAAAATMRANRSRDTGPEMALRRALHSAGLRFRVDVPLPFDRRRRADIVFTRVGLYVFVDGCFWHGCSEHFVVPKTRREFWTAKVASNRERDLDTTGRLEAAGNAVIRVWEHEDPSTAATRIVQLYFQRRTL
ncbi:very short patch repair endonuclease [Nocardioides sp. WG-D5]